MSYTEGNKLIASFMGYEYIPFNSDKHTKPMSFTSGYWEKIEKKLAFLKKSEFRIYGAKLNYESSWDQLMKVIYRIESTKKANVHCSINTNNCIITVDDNNYTSSPGSPSLISFTYGSEGKIKNTWKCVIAFIKWFQKEFNIIFESELDNYTVKLINKTIVGIKDVSNQITKKEQ